jgi:acetylornithine deacetylase/succinyl-diaminopimelate desuccinylase-like protein
MSSIPERIDRALPVVLGHLEELVRIPSVSSLPEHADDVAGSARASADLLTDLGLSARVVYAGGLPSVIAHRPAPPGAPTVLLYAHHDVQPPGEVTDWASDPFEPTARDGRLYARGAADDKAGLAVHLAALIAHGDDLPVGVTVLVDGEEEIGSPSLPDLLDRYRDDLAADVIVVADSVNWAVGTPSLTVVLRGLVDAVVELRTLEHPLHSGAWGGPLPDALTTLVRTLATLHDADGSVAVAGLARGAGSDVDYDEPRFRKDAGLLDGVHLTGTGSITDRLWLQPCITVTAIDSQRVDGAANMLSASARAKLSMRIAPGDDPSRAFAALSAHLAAHTPHGAHLTVIPGPLAHPVRLTPPPAVRAAALDALRTAWDGAEPVEIGVGGTLPLIKLFTDAFPDAAVLVTGVEDPDTRAHGPNESLHLGDFRNACVAEALLLERLGRPGDAS